MSLRTQAKLVKALIEQSFEPVGSSDPVSFDARIIAASTKSLKDLIVKGRFREDLFFKLNVIPMAIPPLRERTEDIPLLIDHFLTVLLRPSTARSPRPCTPRPSRPSSTIPGRATSARS